MISQDTILQTKITAPTVKEYVLRRAKIARKLKAVTNFGVTMVHSGPGYGKSTIVASFVPAFDAITCWYTATELDDELIPFLRYVIHSIRNENGEFGENLLYFLDRMDRYIREEEVQDFCSLFINEIAKIQNSLILIIDDFHFVQNNTEIIIWFHWLLHHIPNNLHLILITRQRPDWEMVTAMKVKNELMEITEDDLKFSKDEVEVLLQDVYMLDVNTEDIELIYSLSEGWVMALGLLSQRLVEQASTDVLFMTQGTLEDLFKYLATEVFMKQTPMVQQFLEQTSILDVLSGEICDEVLGINGSNYMLQSLTERHLFITVNGKDRYRYHALFKEFLERRLKVQDLQYMQLHKRCAKWYMKQRDILPAIAHFEKINDYSSIGALIHEHGVQLLEQGQLSYVLEKLLKINVPTKDRYYMLWYIQGEILRYRCQYEESEAAYKKGLDAARISGDSLVIIRSLKGIAKIYLDTIQPIKAERVLSEAIKMLQTCPIEKSEENQLYAIMAENLLNAGHAGKALEWFEKLDTVYKQEKAGNLEARILLRSGNLQMAKKLLLNKKKGETDGALPQSHRETDLLLSLVEAFIGNADQAKGLADAGIKQGIKLQAPFVEACGWIRLGHAVQLMEVYDSVLAKDCYQTALEIMEELNVSRGKAEANMGLCILYTYQGAYEKAVLCGEEALKETEEVKDNWLSGLIYLAMKIASIQNTKWERVEFYGLRASKLLRKCGDKYAEMLLNLWESIYHYERQEWNAFPNSINSFLNSLQTGNYEFILFNRTTFGPSDLQRFTPLLMEAQNRGIQREYVTSLLNELGFSNVQNHPGYTLKIQALGNFRVWLGHKEVDAKDWQRAKAKELLEYFVTKRNNHVVRDEIFAALWPNVPEKSMTRDFKVALNALNNALEPERKARTEPFFIQREGNSYGLSPNSGYIVDAIEFESFASAGLEEQDPAKAQSFLEKALALYKGDFLPDQKYADWCLNERERLLVYYLRCSEKLAQLLVARKEYDAAIQWCERVIEKDPTWEEAYRLLMFCYYQKNNRSQAMKWFAKCKQYLESELGVEPMFSTKQMYDMVLGKAN
ncbi:BTAD domain-containing putative transcriptional regulator [Sutcliffiella horikoshii]|uniref:BTAD domain-containing putative transcriptional regulator n=1 Tax=Sutcliffiella horikoshii TaxID=79883 RepID=UPI001F3738B6|nr:BTAD domain-containing putative transcriptional regulator [Sutcliffiella horikoshii]MCG1022405.1 transcriptional regulator [Sutcliffiella horikoshii]